MRLAVVAIAGGHRVLRHPDRQVVQDRGAVAGSIEEAVRRAGVDYAQGFHIGRPGPIGEILERRTPTR